MTPTTALNPNLPAMSQNAARSRLTCNEEDSERWREQRPFRLKGDAVQTDPFEEYRSLLFAIAYRMLGSAMEAEDIVQEAYLRYHATPPESIRTLKRFLTTIVHHLCLDHLKSAQVRRENYVGPWLPEPILTGDGAAPRSPLRQISDQESISMAFLVLLESLSPLERAVFLLREVFDYEYAEIAQISGRDEAACRQLFSRAKKHIRDHRPRFPASPAAHANMVGRFMEACMAGNMDGLMRLLAEDVTVWSDSGGKVAGASRRPIQGRDNVARATIGLLARAPEGTTFEVIEANGLPALLIRVRGQIVGVLTLEVEGDFIRAMRNVANPDKLAHLKLSPTAGQK
ncbi:MAG TPA: RNA polymerase sigma-70 factor [Caldilineaceae bacterium]|nr:RNA polymerase sigma-70 factor [Caldilineaceae bacterium]